jgi:hypothetical protein
MGPQVTLYGLVDNELKKHPNEESTIMKRIAALSAAVAGLWLWRSKSRNSGSHADTPGVSKQLETKVLEAGAALLQSKSPVNALNLYLNGFHFFADDMGRQMEAHHYCTRINEDFTQCVIFDGNTRNARLIGVEYIISEQLFRGLPEEEKILWHSHHYEVGSGTLIAPGLPQQVEHRVMEKIVSTYGKTWHTWDTHQHGLPLGIPALMMGFTEDGQLQSELLSERDRRFDISSAARKSNRSDIPMPVLIPGANSWQSGPNPCPAQREIEEVERCREK